MVEGYSHELSSCGFWPGGGEEGAFYAYAYPAPDGFDAYPVEPAGASYNPDLQQFLLPYEVVRQSADPDQAVRDFLRTTYEAAANLAHWDRDGLEDDPSRWSSAQVLPCAGHREAGERHGATRHDGAGFRRGPVLGRATNVGRSGTLRGS
ncbi:hypothetical protein GCM10023175_40610 [Pseudonocardia xishanensis]|uniref:Uncharacterized protein n=1 Tax=Pseudonocardia xishanensis TaxID=630995 RepID=A0ABP8RW26_9PSEU